MTVMECLELVKKYAKCPECGCETTIECDTTENHFKCACHCGWFVEIK